LANELSTSDEKRARQIVRELLAAYAENEDLITIGAYRKGANRTLDAAVEMRDEIHRLLKQQVDEQVAIAQVRQDLIALAAKCLTRINSAPAAMGTPPQMPPMQPQRQSPVIKR
jgi:flagellum-specific ATP synthase